MQLLIMTADEVVLGFCGVDFQVISKITFSANQMRLVLPFACRLQAATHKLLIQLPLIEVVTRHTL